MWLGEKEKGTQAETRQWSFVCGKTWFQIFFLHTFSHQLSLHSLSVSLCLSLSTHPVWSWLIISTGISCVAHQGWKHFNLRGKTNSRGWQISMSRWQLLPVISFNYHIISFYRRGAGCRAANEGARSHAELRAFLNCCQQLTGVRDGEVRGRMSPSEEFLLQVILFSDTDGFILNELPTDNGHCLVGNGQCA